MTRWMLPDIFCREAEKLAIHGGKARPVLGAPVFLCHPEGRLCGFQRRAVLEPPDDQRVDRFGTKKRPPLLGDVSARDEALRRAAGTRSRYGFGGQGPFGVGTHRRRIGALEIGSDGAPCQAKGKRRSSRRRFSRSISVTPVYSGVPIALLNFPTERRI